MTQKQLIAIAVGLFILILALLIWRRFDMPEQLDVSVTAVNGGSSYEVNDSIRRGATIDSEDSYVQLQISENIFVSFDSPEMAHNYTKGHPGRGCFSSKSLNSFAGDAGASSRRREVI